MKITLSAQSRRLRLLRFPLIVTLDGVRAENSYWTWRHYMIREKNEHGRIVGKWGYALTPLGILNTLIGLEVRVK